MIKIPHHSHTTDFDIVIAGNGPAGSSFARHLSEIISNKEIFIAKYQKWLDNRIIKKLQQNHKELKIGIINGVSPQNQFVAVWDSPNDELAPFGLNVKKFARHYTPTVEWEFPFTSFIYNTNYCSIDHLKVVQEFNQRIKEIGRAHV